MCSKSAIRNLQEFRLGRASHPTPGTVPEIRQGVNRGSASTSPAAVPPGGGTDGPSTRIRLDAEVGHSLGPERHGEWRLVAEDEPLLIQGPRPGSGPGCREPRRRESRTTGRKELATLASSKTAGQLLNGNGMTMAPGPFTPGATDLAPAPSSPGRSWSPDVPSAGGPAAGPAGSWSSARPTSWRSGLPIAVAHDSR